MKNQTVKEMVINFKIFHNKGLERDPKCVNVKDPKKESKYNLGSHNSKDANGDLISCFPFFTAKETIGEFKSFHNLFSILSCQRWSGASSVA